jgi:hypothetical protein
MSAIERWDERTARVETELQDEARRRRLIDATFTPWERDPARIARLFLWLANIKEVPTTAKAIAAFIEDPTPFTAQYEVMCIFEHPRPEAA